MTRCAPRAVSTAGHCGDRRRHNLSTLLSGLKRYSSHITAIVTVADDGGSSGCCAESWVLPPGDIRNCLAALSTEEPLLTRLFQYRFSLAVASRDTADLFLSALTAITGNLETAITASSRVLAVQGRLFPPPMWMCASGRNWKTANASKVRQHRPGPQPDRSSRLHSRTPSGPAPGTRSHCQRRPDPARARKRTPPCCPTFWCQSLCQPFRPVAPRGSTSAI